MHYDYTIFYTTDADAFRQLKPVFCEKDELLVNASQLYIRELITMLDELGIRGFTYWEDVQGRGHENGDPHRGTHTWPEMNSAMLVVVEDDKVESLLTSIRKLDKRNPEVGVRAFVWNIEQMV